MSDSATTLYKPQHDRLKAVSIHIPKNGGNSVSALLYGCPSLVVGGHITALQFRNADPQKFRDYFIFAFVRNPFSRLYSAYRYLWGGGLSGFDSEFAAQYVQPFASFTEFVKSLPNRPEALQYWHLRPQCAFISDESGSVIVDRVARVEAFDAELAAICAHLKLPFRPVHENRGAYLVEPLGSVYDEDSLNIARGIYREDFETLKYSKDV